MNEAKYFQLTPSLGHPVPGKLKKSRRGVLDLMNDVRRSVVNFLNRSELSMLRRTVVIFIDLT
jgi:hypothetical protein